MNAPTTTAIHRRVERLRAGQDPTFVARVPSGWVAMGEAQVLEGYCLLLPDPVVPHLNALAPAARLQFLTDMARVGDALLATTGGVRANYALFGNVEPALHAHVFPRRADEPPERATAQPWAWDWGAAPQFSLETHGALLTRIRAALDAA